MKKWLIGLFLIGLAGGIFGYRMYNKPHNNMASSRSIATVNAKEIQNAFESDESAANKKYLGNVITVSGKISEINQADITNAYIVLETESMLSTLKCQLDHLAKHPMLNKLKVGDQIELKGICTGYLMDVIIERAVIL